MSFRLRLILAFTVLALLQAGLFTALSDQLIRDGLEGEASARLGLVASLAPKDLPLGDLGPLSATGLRTALAAFALRYELARATLLSPRGVYDSAEPHPSNVAKEWWLADGLVMPQAHGAVKVSGPLFKAEDGWRKVLYAKLDPQREMWLRLEAGTPFLGQVAAVQQRLLRLSAALALPALALGLGLGWLLSRRARSLAARLASPAGGVILQGRDEFARISVQVQDLLDSLAIERERAGQLAAARLSQAHDLSRGVAHELRNPLASLSLLADVLLRRRREGAAEAELEDLGTRFQAEVTRLGATVARFMEFARKPELAPSDQDVGLVMQALLIGLRPVPQVEGRAVARVDAKVLATILGVLLANACEAAGEIGQVRVHLTDARGQAVVRVWDSGEPLDAALRERLFTPFTTTKPKGLGLGLATAASLADQSGGSLSLLDDGKTFVLVLPTP